MGEVLHKHPFAQAVSYQAWIRRSPAPSPAGDRCRRPLRRALCRHAQHRRAQRRRAQQQAAPAGLPIPRRLFLNVFLVAFVVPRPLGPDTDSRLAISAHLGPSSSKRVSRLPISALDHSALLMVGSSYVNSCLC